MDEKYMELAIALAKKGVGKVNPNPMVGAVVVKDGKIIGEGYHEYHGGAHAEVNALKGIEGQVEGATLYVTLEPCYHYGKTPPCVEKIIKNKLAKVVIGMLDPNPLVAGQSIVKLQQQGIEVVTGVLESKCKKLNEVFIKYITKREPFVILKTAMSLDGKIATTTGQSKWITSEESREKVHRLRNEITGIMVGVNTIIKDNPQLTCRVENGRNPVRIVVDSTLRIPIDSDVINNWDKKTIIGTTEKANIEKIKILEELGVTVIVTQSKNNKVNLKELMIKLGQLNIDGILLEGGATLNYSALEAGIIDKIEAYIAPKIIGGEKAKTPVGGQGFENIRDAIELKEISYKKIKEDILVEGYIRKVGE